MTPRPIAVTTIAWVQIAFIALGAIGLAMTLALFNDPNVQDALAKIHAPIPLQITMSILSLVINLTCAIGFLKRQNWARFVFVVWAIIAIVYAFIATPFSMWMAALSLVLPVITTVIIFMPNANRFFSGKGEAAPAATE